MFMTTKTITIMEDAYNLLLEKKPGGESFSEAIRRITSKKKSRKLTEFFGLISEKEGKAMLRDLEKIRSENIKLLKER